MTLKERYYGLQTVLTKCGDEGCHFLTLCSIIEEVNNKPLDLIDAIRVAQSKGWFDTNFYGKAADLFLNHFTGKKWKRKRCDKLPPVLKDNEYTEAVYYNSNTGYFHYRRRGFDTIVDSITVRDGIIVEYYIWFYEE